MSSFWIFFPFVVKSSFFKFIFLHYIDVAILWSVLYIFIIVRSMLGLWNAAVVPLASLTCVRGCHVLPVGHVDMSFSPRKNTDNIMAAVSSCVLAGDTPMFLQQLVPNQLFNGVRTFNVLCPHPRLDAILVHSILFRLLPRIDVVFFAPTAGRARLFFYGHTYIRCPV